LGRDGRTISKWLEEGLPLAKRGRGGRPSLYDEAKCRRWIASREKQTATPGVVDLARERARKERAQAVLAEQTFQARSRELLPRAEVEKMWAAEVAAVRTKLLALPTVLADQLHRAAVLEGVDGVEARLQTAILDVLTELATSQVEQSA
jgi:phage terminase Nu1 subunit (DNA packaging protein)